MNHVITLKDHKTYSLRQTVHCSCGFLSYPMGGTLGVAQHQAKRVAKRGETATINDQRVKRKR